MKKLLLCIAAGVFSLQGFAQNVAPPVPTDTAAGNGHTMKTELKIDVKDDIDKITVKHSSARPKLLTKTFELTDADPSVLRTILSGVINGSKDRSQVGDTRVESVRYKGQDFTGLLIVTAPEDRFEDSDNGGLSIPKLIKMMDQPLMLDLQAQFHFQEYQAKYKPANELKELVERFILDTIPQATIVTADVTDIIAAGGPAAYVASKEKDGETETKFGNDFVMLDKELNQLFIGCAPVNADDVREFLEQQDQPYENLNVKVTIYEVANKNELDLGNDFNAWKDANAAAMFNMADGGQTLDLKAELDAKYFDFLAKKGKAKIYSSMNMVLRPDKESTFEQRKIKTLTLAKATGAGTTAGAQTPGKVSTSKKGDVLLETTAKPADGGYVQTVTAPLSSTSALGINAALAAFITDEFYYGTSLSITPYKQGDYSKLVLDIDNISLVGFNDDGSAKSAVSTLNTEVVVNNEGTEYVAGYLSRKEVVKVVKKVPFLGSIPYLGYLFSTEDDQTKTHQLVVVVSCVEEEYNKPDSVNSHDVILGIKDEVGKSEVDPEPRYDQLDKQ